MLSRYQPVLGVCLGSQLLAHVLGAKVYAGRSKEIGWYPVTLSRSAASDALWSEIPSTFMAYHWHGDAFDLPANCELLASSALTPHQAFRYGANAYGILFHMEVTRPLIETMTDSFAEELREINKSAAQIRQQADEFLPPLDRIGQAVFALGNDGSRSFAYDLNRVFNRRSESLHVSVGDDSQSTVTIGAISPFRSENRCSICLQFALGHCLEKTTREPNHVAAC